jgi:hypothetical protein
VRISSLKLLGGRGWMDSMTMQSMEMSQCGAGKRESAATRELHNRVAALMRKSQRAGVVHRGTTRSEPRPQEHSSVEPTMDGRGSLGLDPGEVRTRAATNTAKRRPVEMMMTSTSAQAA